MYPYPLGYLINKVKCMLNKKISPETVHVRGYKLDHKQDASHKASFQL